MQHITTRQAATIKLLSSVRTINTRGLRLTRRELAKLQDHEPRKTPRAATTYRTARRNAFSSATGFVKGQLSSWTAWNRQFGIDLRAARRAKRAAA